MWRQRITDRKQQLIAACFILAVFFVVVITTSIFVFSTSAGANPARTLNFQGRLLQSSGAVVPDGYYNMQFKVYEGGSGTAVNNPDGSLKWTESYVNDQANAGVRVKNGLFSVNLGSRTPFGTAIDWNASTVWLSMNVAGSAADCTTFGSGACAADGEMLPMKQMTATPFAMNAGQLGGKTADNFVQIAQGVQTDTSNNTSSIHLNKTGTGNILQLQNNGNNVFSVTNDGNLEFGNSRNHAIYVGGSPENTVGHNLTIFAGYGGSGDGAMGGSLFLQGGSAGGDNANGGDVAITGGTGSGTGRKGNVYIGASDTDTVQIGSVWHEGTQTINIGNNSGSGRTDVTIGGSGEGSGTTRIQSGDDTTISTNGTQRARFSGEGNTLYLGNADSSGQATVASGFSIQGTSSTGSGVQGGGIDIIAGSATNGNANGGNLTLSGGSGSGDGSDGLVVISTPTYVTSAGDANCFTNGDLVSEHCTFTSTSVNTSSVLMAGFDTPEQTATVPDPSNPTAGRVLYVSAVGNSEPFELRINPASNAEQTIKMRPNMSLTLLWNGVDWTVASALIEVPSFNDLASNGGAEVAGATLQEFPENTWFEAGSTVSRNTNPSYVASGKASVKIEGNDDGSFLQGAANRLRTTLQPDTPYTVSFLAYLESGTFDDLAVIYASGLESEALQGSECTSNVQIPAGQWQHVTCTFTTPPEGLLSDNVVAIWQVNPNERTYYIDDFSVTASLEPAEYIPYEPEFGFANLESNDESTPLSARSSTTQTSSDETSDEALFGSMYYDESLNEVQCYEEEGWGSCAAAPDTFVTLSASYPGVVIDESGKNAANFSTGFCSGTLNVNAEGDNAICAENETHNYYQLNVSEATSQPSLSTLYVTYSLPDNFKEFVPEATSVTAKAQATDSEVRYHIYKNKGGELTACGDMITAASGTSPSWQQALASGGSDPANCDFKPGDSILLKIELSLPPKASAEGQAAAYVSDINFVFRNN